MARFNEILVGRYNRFLQKFLMLKGGPPAPQLTSEIGAGFILFNGVENLFLETWNRFAVSVTAVAGAGAAAQVQIANPTGTNVIAVLERITVALTSTGQALLLFNNNSTTALPTPVTPFALDRRQGISQNSSMVLSSSNVTGAVGSAIWSPLLLSNTTYDAIYDNQQELPLTPGTLYAVASPVGVAFTIVVSYLWRERFLEESERF
jgi:hypothetical protein